MTKAKKAAPGVVGLEKALKRARKALREERDMCTFWQRAYEQEHSRYEAFKDGVKAAKGADE